MSVRVLAFTADPNAGDEFGQHVVRRYIAKNAQFHSTPDAPLEPHLLLLGSILEYGNQFSIACGAGLIRSDSTNVQLSRAVSVRGPLTARRLSDMGLPTSKLFGDPGVLASEFVKQRQSPSTAVGVIPHYVDKRHAWLDHARREGARVIDIQAPVLQVLREIADCRVIVSSSLHGIIFAHALQRDAAWVRLSDAVVGGNFKFRDYYASLSPVSADMEPILVVPETPLAAVTRMAAPGDQAKLRANCLEAMSEAAALVNSRMRLRGLWLRHQSSLA